MSGKKENNLQDLKKKFNECQKLKEDYLAGWKRARADFVNYKKNEEERLSQLKDFIKENLVLKILPILDNIDIAEKRIPSELKNNEWVRGLLQIKNQILDFLNSENVKEIKSIGEKFDPNFHEAIEEVKVKNKESGIVVEEVKKGYTFNNKVIRPAMVKIVK